MELEPDHHRAIPKKHRYSKKNNKHNKRRHYRCVHGDLREAAAPPWFQWIVRSPGRKRWPKTTWSLFSATKRNVSAWTDNSFLSILLNICHRVYLCQPASLELVPYPRGDPLSPSSEANVFEEEKAKKNRYKLN